ncbi:hypothetical protein NDU88_003695 [Pleurodeles waltl]|uniref:Uncharacterized protein n=1 Tax=Pleurodeles waltl TaxID=8319 RepID=A0AAV7KZ72_PLEWA|nr:hypothetical protein NDU88_003695 [Pleurodeles waltl]
MVSLLCTVSAVLLIALVAPRKRWWIGVLKYSGRYFVFRLSVGGYRRGVCFYRHGGRSVKVAVYVGSFRHGRNPICFSAGLFAAIRTLQAEVHQLKEKNAGLHTWLEDTEGSSSRNDICLVGIPEKEEGMEVGCLWKPDAELSTQFVIERAHRVPGTIPKLGSRLRPLLARILNFRDQDAILRMASMQHPLHIANHKIWISPDAQEVQVRHKSFGKVQGEFQRRNLQYTMIFQAGLKVIAEGLWLWFFDAPEEAWEWLEAGTRW